MTPHVDEERLNDWVDGLLEADEARVVETHVATCAACRDDADRLRALLALTAELPASIEPPPGTWESIAARTVDLGRARREILRGMRLPLAAAAAVLVSLSAGATALLLRGDEAATTAPVVAAADARPATGTSATLVAAEDTYEREFDRLIGEFRARRDALDPATVTVVEENLLIIEGALAAAKAALGADPSNRDLPLLITDTHRQRIQLVERALRLSTRPQRSEA